MQAFHAPMVPCFPSSGRIVSLECEPYKWLHINPVLLLPVNGILLWGRKFRSTNQWPVSSERPFSWWERVYNNSWYERYWIWLQWGSDAGLFYNANIHPIFLVALISPPMRAQTQAFYHLQAHISRTGLAIINDNFILATSTLIVRFYYSLLVELRDRTSHHCAPPRNHIERDQFT